MMTNIWVSSTCLLFCTTAHFMMRVYLISVTELTYCRADWKLYIQYYEFTFDKWVSMCARCPYRHCVHTSGHHGDPAPAAMWPTGWNPTTWLNTVITKHRFVQFPHHKLWLFKLFTRTHTHTQIIASRHISQLLYRVGDNKWLPPFCRMPDCYSVWLVQRHSSQQQPWISGVCETDRTICWKTFTSTVACGRTVGPPPLDWHSVTTTTASWETQVGEGVLMLLC